MSASDAPSLFNVLRPDIDTALPPMQEGDCAIILRANGDFKILTTGVDAARLAGDPDLWTQKEHDQIALGQKLMAISLALSNDQIMAVLINLASDPDVLDPERLKHIANPN